jgi:DNA mismatch repair protein MutL
MQGFQLSLRSSFFKPKEDTVTIRPVSAPQAKAAKEYLPHQVTMAEPVPVQNNRPAQTVIPKTKPEKPVVAQDFFAKQQAHGLKVVGQFKNLYIFCQSSDGLIVIDQHAAHERLLFEKLKKQFLQGNVASQNLMFPETVELSLADSAKVEQYADSLEKMGFNIRDFGDNSYVISAVPALGSHISPSDLFLDVLEQFASRQSKSTSGSMQEDILASMACKSAVKAGDNLSTEEIEALLNNMAKADLFSHCPHGRPVLKQFSDTDIKKWFHRT